ncbi:MAG TPA: hypothetical protein VK451_00955 [Methyloceanibacter sp.]|nr:hypothetical protein [Methyloceanibacter sp.]
MLRPLTLLACSIALAFTITSAEAKKDKGPLPCGDYDGVPSHNDCAPVSAELQAKCQKWIDKGNATSDPDKKNLYKHKYFHCVGYS